MAKGIEILTAPWGYVSLLVLMMAVLLCFVIILCTRNSRNKKSSEAQIEEAKEEEEKSEIRTQEEMRRSDTIKYVKLNIEKDKSSSSPESEHISDETPQAHHYENVNTMVADVHLACDGGGGGSSKEIPVEHIYDTVKPKPHIDNPYANVEYKAPS
ncbi:unnamed protein product [Lymnaea stagnalis]|uniref:Uncharacterized protein n=1 Tax=Lymnaea stagnalis TaxID=6523 RepID=A0AAV2IHE2_LYMST